MSTRILAIDTATEACSVALWNNGEVQALFELCPREHTQRILPMVQQILASSGLSLQQLDALAFGRGPGSFTGVRIGIGIGQGLALGANLPMIGVSTLQTMAQGAFRLTGATRVLAAIDARMGEVYWGEFERNAEGHWLGEHTEAVMTPAQTWYALRRLVVTGPRWERAGRLILIWLVAVISHWLMGKCHCHRRKICSHWLCHHGLGVTRSKLNRLNRSTCVMKLPGKNCQVAKTERHATVSRA